MRALQAQVKQTRDNLAPVVAACAALANLDALDWKNLSSAVGVYLTDKPSALRASSQTDAGNGYVAELARWHDKLVSLGCKPPYEAEGTIKVPPLQSSTSAAPSAPLVSPATEEGLGKFFGASADTLKWVAIAFVAFELLKK